MDSLVVLYARFRMASYLLLAIILSLFCRIYQSASMMIALSRVLKSFAFCRDGYMTNGAYGSIRNYEPSVLDGYKDNWNLKEPILDPLHFESESKLGQWDYREDDDDYYTQAGDLYRLMSGDEKERLCQTIADTMKGINEKIIKLQLEHFNKADANYGKRIAELLK